MTLLSLLTDQGSLGGEAASNFFRSKLESAEPIKQENQTTTSVNVSLSGTSTSVTILQTGPRVSVAVIIMEHLCLSF